MLLYLYQKVLKIPECSYYKWRFDQLYVNGKRATLARTPNTGFLKIGKVKENVWIKGNGRAPEKAQQILYFDNNNFSLLYNFKNEIRTIFFIKPFNIR